MIKLLDGPAAGIVLSLRRAPIVLRVVCDARPGVVKEPWDALDQPEDAPKPTEIVHVYVMADYRGMIHISARGAGGKAIRGWWPSAEYRFLSEQPGDVHTRDGAAWSEWCDANKERICAELPSAILERVQS